MDWMGIARTRRPKGAVALLNIIGVYLEPTTSSDSAKRTQKVLEDKVQKCVNRSENCIIMGDIIRLGGKRATS